MCPEGTCLALAQLLLIFCASYLILEQRSRLSKLFIFANLDQINGELKKDNLDKEGHKISSCQIVFVTQRSSRKFLLAHQHSKSAQLNDRQLLLEKPL